MALVLVCGLTFADVIGRYFFSSPIAPATDLTEMLMVLVIFCAMPVVAARSQNIVIDLLDPYTPRWLARIRDIVVALIAAGFFLVAAWRLVVLAQRAMRTGSVTSYLGWPMAPILIVICVFCVVTALGFIWAVIQRRTGQGEVG